MRGEDVQQRAMYNYLSPEERVPAKHPLRAIRQITDRVLKGLSRLLARMYARLGRPSIPPEKLLRALWLQILYTLRSERIVGLNMDEEVWDVTVFTKNRERLLKADVAQRFFQLGVEEAQALDLMLDEHFTVDGTLMEACASLKRFKKMDEAEEESRRLEMMIPAIRPWTLMARSAVIRPISRRPMRRPCWPAKDRARKQN
jgi:transposase